MLDPRRSSAMSRGGPGGLIIANMGASFARRLQFTLGAILLLFCVSTLGYIWLEGFTIAEAAYMTAITLTTVGFGEVQPLSPTGRIFTIVIILFGVSIVAFSLSTMTEYVVAGELGGALRKKRMSNIIDKLRDHYIICGYGRVGQGVAQGLVNQEADVVVVDTDKAALQRCEQNGIPFLDSDATEDDTLRQAGIERARGLIAVLNNDASNVFVVLSARFLNPDLSILARATCEDAERKLKQAGADRIVSPYEMASTHIVNQLTRPHVTSFVYITTGQNLELALEEVEVSPESSLIGHSLAESELRSRTGATVLSIVRGDDNQVLDWSPDIRIEAKDVLIVLVKPGELKAISLLAEDPRYA